MKKTYHGSCHCGAVRFEADIDLASGTGRCNCSFCAKSRWWSATIKPEDFRLVAGEDDLSDYQFASMQGHHVFCKHCGLHSFGRGDIKEWIGPFVSINVACLDDVEPAELAALDIKFANGRDNDWFHPPSTTSHL